MGCQQPWLCYRCRGDLCEPTTYLRGVSAYLQEWELEDNTFLAIPSTYSETPVEPPVAEPPALSQKQFHHKALNLSRNEFRLLRIQHKKSHRSETIECKIRTFKFGKRPFIALSYAWGDLTCSQKKIKINGLPFSVGPNLWEFLKVALQTNITEWLWIDALCIDQSNIAERNHQVGLMDKIYEGAFKVIAWLGPEANGSDQIVDLIGSAVRLNFDTSFRDFTKQRLSRNHFFLRPFWRRIWIIQELLLAEEVVFMCGRKTVGIWGMSIWIRRMKLELELDPTIFTSSTDVMTAMQCVFAISENRSRPVRRWRRREDIKPYNFRLRNSLEAFQLFESSDIRDRVYGLLSLVKPEDRIPVDYLKTAEQVFCDVIHKLATDKVLFPKLKDLQIFSWRLNSVWRLDGLYPLIVKDSAVYAFHGAEADRLYHALQSWRMRRAITQSLERNNALE
jgi:hypothetical protein